MKKEILAMKKIGYTRFLKKKKKFKAAKNQAYTYLTGNNKLFKNNPMEQGFVLHGLRVFEKY